MNARRLGSLAGGLALGLLLAGGVALMAATDQALGPPPPGLDTIQASARRLQVLDRHGQALNTTYANRWNLFDHHALHEIPPLLVQAVLTAEDQNFYYHRGQDWLARLHAVAQNLRAGKVVRGGSTISEQVVRMLRPRPRSLWSRWLEGWDAQRLERRHDKRDVLEFYLNQVPFAANRRGVVQAARYYFDRDLPTLNEREMLALAVLLRAPSRLDLFNGDPARLQRDILRLGRRMAAREQLGSAEFEALTRQPFALQRPRLSIEAPHFLRYVTGLGQGEGVRLHTTLDGSLQTHLQALLDQRLRSLARYGVDNGAMLVADHRSGEILAWVVGGAGDPRVPSRRLDAVLAARQPGSALKPFLYALALERGWTAATAIDDSPLATPVGRGLHEYRNYSQRYHGPVTLRQALGNSLNIPALRTLREVGIDRYYAALRELGFDTLSLSAAHYGEGLALGNGEVSLLALVRAYATLANRGRGQALTPLQGVRAEPGRRFVSPEIASLVGHILSDPQARRLEFGADSVLNLPVPTAVKTGTSSDHRDSWAVGYDARWVVGVWMGNLNQRPTEGLTGASGPALGLRSALAWLNRDGRTSPLWLSPKLRAAAVCADGGRGGQGERCRQRREYFIPGTEPQRIAARAPAAYPPPAAAAPIRLIQPTPGLRLAVDPRLAPRQQAFEFALAGVGGDDRVEWRVDQRPEASLGPRLAWQLARGEHVVSARVWRAGELIAEVGETRFVVQ